MSDTTPPLGSWTVGWFTSVLNGLVRAAAVTTFEGPIRFPGGPGGRQSHRFVLAPDDLRQQSAPLMGASSTDDLFPSFLRNPRWAM